MRYIFAAVVILGLALGGTVVAEPDRALAYADHRLVDLGRVSGNPYLLIGARNQIHALRYARAKLEAPVKLKIQRRDDPARIIPAPTPVVDPRTYQYGSPLGGVLPPDAPNTPARVAAVQFVDSFDEKYTFAGRVNQDFAVGWTGYTVWGEPTSDGEFTTRRSGEWAQKISGHASFRGGILRQFNAAPGTQYDVSVWAHLYVLGGGAVHIGVDPYGGTDPNASTVVWYPQATTLGEWMQLGARGQAYNSVITVFLEGYSLFDDNTNAYFDDFSIQVFQPI